MSDADPDPAEVTLALKLAFLRGSWEAVSEIIQALEDAFGKVSLVDAVRELQEEDDYLNSMEATNEHPENPLVLVDWGPTPEA